MPTCGASHSSESRTDRQTGEVCVVSVGEVGEVGNEPDAAALLREAVAAALRLPHPAPQALALAALVDQRAEHATELEAQYNADPVGQEATTWGRRS